MNDLYFINLYDYYKNLFTEKQRLYFENYFFENYSLTEISENFKVSKQALSKQLSEIKKKLLFYEKALNLYANSLKIKEILGKDTSKIEDLI
jgi:predicted DNA-binding protein YlxM (UPF0122 family)